MGLNDKLKAAATEQVVESLLAEGKGYTLASPKTQRRWQYVANRRVKELRPQPKSAPKAEKETDAPAKASPETNTGRVINRHKKYRKA